MKTINVNNTIENYLGGTAGKVEEEWLKNEMKSNPHLAREVKLRQKTDEIIAQHDVIDLRHKLGVIEMKKRSSGVLRRTIIKATKYAAAVIMAALISSALYFLIRPDSSSDKLYSEYYSRYVSPGAVRSVVSPDNTLMQNAIALYSAKEYDKAISYLEQIISSDQDNMESVFMHGVANMEISNYPVASGSFNRVIEQNDNLYLEDAAWYLGLCYMMTDNNEKAVKQFEAIAASKSRYCKQARKLVRHLR